MWFAEFLAGAHRLELGVERTDDLVVDQPLGRPESDHHLVFFDPLQVLLEGAEDGPVEKQAEADVLMNECWKAQNGKLVFNGKGHNLCTIKDYKDFEMIVDWRINKQGDSGIYLR